MLDYPGRDRKASQRKVVLSLWQGMEWLEPQTKNGASDVHCDCEYVGDTDELVYIVDQANITQNKVLSDGAKVKICRDTMDGKYSNRNDAKELPLMVPVTDASQYSCVQC